MTGKVLVCVLLGVMGVEDMRTRKVALWKIILFLSAAFLNLAVKSIVGNSDIYIEDILISLLPGIFLLAAGKVSGWAVGPADGLIVLGLGLYLGTVGVMKALLAACMTAAAAAGFLVVCRKKDRKYQIPFVPFLLAGTAGYLICG